MKRFFSWLFATFLCFPGVAQIKTYVGSTPVHGIVRNFLEISATDSIDFIRWKLNIDLQRFTLDCTYGLAKPGTPGFSNEQRVAFAGQLREADHHYYLKHKDKSISIFEMNTNVLHFVDDSNHLLSGNGGYSYTLNSLQPVEANDFYFHAQNTHVQGPLVFEGRTPCQELSTLLGLNNTGACDKMKWYFLFYTDSITGKPSYFLMAGTGYRKETMARGSWQIVNGENGRIIYQVSFDRWVRPLNFLKGDENVLFFVGAKGELLVGNENFSYTLNRRKNEYPASTR